MKKLIDYGQYGPLCLRLIIGFGFMAHGWAKINRGTAGFGKLLAQTGMPMPQLTADVTAYLELAGGTLILLGAFVSFISIPLIVVMLAAMLTVHLKHGFSSVKTIGLTPDGPQFGPPGYEINLLYIAGLVSLMLTGAGKLSLDAWQWGRKSKTLPVAILLAGFIAINISPASASRVRVNDMRDTMQVPLLPEDVSPLLTGEMIPKASLPDADGMLKDLNAMVAQKPAILVFYRGGWCPYCTRQLSGLQSIEEELKNMGYQVIAVSTDSPENLKQTGNKQRLSYTLLSDADLALARQFGIAYKAPANYQRFLPATSGGKNREMLLPVPSVFILGQNGRIRFEYINPDFTQRLSASLLKAAATAVREENNK